jgi:dipeptidyl-peptidase-4
MSNERMNANNTIEARYQQAQALVDGNLSSNVVKNDCVFPHWIEGRECFWYLRETTNGHDYRLVNAEMGSNDPAFDHQALADALGATLNQEFNPESLSIADLVFDLPAHTICFTAAKKRWRFDRESATCEAIPESKKTDGLISSDGHKSAFIRDHNLWLRDIATGEERALTQDGQSELCYGSTTYSTDVEAVWSPDSSCLFTHQFDTRGIDSTPYIQLVPQPDAEGNSDIRPQLSQHKIAYAGDATVESNRLLILNTNSGEMSSVNSDPIPRGASYGGFFSRDKFGWWSQDNKQAYFVNLSRGAKSVQLSVFDVATKVTKVLFEEASNTYLKLSHDLYFDAPLNCPLPETDELIWYSERSGAGHLYLYDLKTGALKHSITGGSDSNAEDAYQKERGKGQSSDSWWVRDILEFDTKRRELLIQTAGRDASVSPYYRDICRVNIDSGELTEVLSGDFEHRVFLADCAEVKTRSGLGFDSGDVSGLSPSGDYLVTTRSRVDTVPQTVLINREGQEIMTVELADVSSLPEGWVWPEPVKTKAADGVTDIYGTVYRPLNFQADQQYPVLDFSGGHVMNSYIAKASFNNSIYSEPYLLGQAYAALGFVVVCLEGRGTSCRNKAFQDYSYGRMASACALEDRVAGIKQLAEKRAYMDITRVGLTSSDGFTSPVYGLLEHPEFYKAAVMICLGDARFEGSGVAEQFEGFTSKAKGHFAEELVENLEGKLLLIHGMMDTSTPVMSTFRLIEALQKANKNFDMLLLPNDSHEVSDYAQRRTWDYLVKHLQGIQPPKEFAFTGTFKRVLSGDA